jgi:anti-sigma factor RsiW
MAMIDRFNSPNEDIEALMPWYEKGTLSEKEARLVADYLESHPERARFLALIREEVSETIEANETAGMPSSAALNRLMDAIAAEPRTQRAVARQHAGGLLARLFGGQNVSPWLAASAAAACLVILVQAAALGVLMTRGVSTGGQGGTVLSSGDPARPMEAGTFALIRFSPAAKAQDITALLRSFNAVIVDGPKPGGVYRVKISSQSLANEQVEEILNQIRTRSDIIAFVSVSG